MTTAQLKPMRRLGGAIEELERAITSLSRVITDLGTLPYTSPVEAAGPTVTLEHRQGGDGEDDTLLFKLGEMEAIVPGALAQVLYGRAAMLGVPVTELPDQADEGPLSVGPDGPLPSVEWELIRLSFRLMWLYGIHWAALPPEDV